MRIPIISKLLERREAPRGYSLSDLDKAMDLAIMGKPSATGINVTESSALSSGAVWACTGLISGTVASLPLITYERLSRGKARAADHPNYSLLHDAPNPEMTAFDFKETIQGHVCTWGNGFAEIDWDSEGYIRALWPLRPDRMKVGRINGVVAYQYRLPSGQDIVLPSYRVWHIHGLGFDGLVGYSPIQMARESIGWNLALREYGNRFFGNGATPGGVLEHPNKLSLQAQNNLRKSWNEMHQGLSNQHRIAILEEGMSYKQVGIPPDSAQFLESQRFSVVDVARWFHVQPHKIQEMSAATFSNIEEQNLEYWTDTVRPWLIRWEQSGNQKLFLPVERGKYFTEHLVDALLRADITRRYNAYAVGRQWGWLSANDVREMENMNPLPDEQGDLYMVPLNMVPADEIGQYQELPTGQPPPEQPAEENSHQSSESRARSVASRQRTANSYQPIFESAGAAIVKREIDNVRRAAKKHLTTRSVSDFRQWLDEFYRDFPEFISRQIKAPVVSLADVISVMAGGEVKSDPDAAKVQKFVDEYIQGFDTRYISSSKGQLQQILKDAETDPNANLTDAIDERLNEWEQKRPGKISMNEPHQLTNAVTRFVWAAAGIRYLVWTTAGTDNCPYCAELDGRRVGIDQVFEGKGDSIDADGKKFVSKEPRFHPPLHLGCQCSISPE